MSHEFTEHELVSLSIFSDVDGDNQIDYEEFMKHFLDIVKRI
jgi:hypothetical protein